MDTTAAALQANVTVATIRTWCRNNVVAAIKQAGRWTIDAASLAHRITLGEHRRDAKAPIVLTSRTHRVPGHIAAVGPETTLRDAYNSGRPVTLSGKHAGERVYLGHRDTARTIGEDRTWTHNGRAVAAYLIDFDRLDHAPRLATLVAAVRARETANAMDVEIRAQRAEDRYLNQPVH